jgi:anti-sigma regulatory factor (Ser/Thr protein kinase)
MSELTAQLDLPLGVGAPAPSRHAVVAVLRGWGYRDERWLEAAALVVSELVTNAVRHGGGAVAFTVQAHAGRVVLCVSDGSSVVPRRRDPDDDGGRGLAVIEARSRSSAVCSRSSAVWSRSARRRFRSSAVDSRSLDACPKQPG